MLAISLFLINPDKRKDWKDSIFKVYINAYDIFIIFFDIRWAIRIKTNSMSLTNFKITLTERISSMKSMSMMIISPNKKNSKNWRRVKKKRKAKSRKNKRKKNEGMSNRKIIFNMMMKRMKEILCFRMKPKANPNRKTMIKMYQLKSDKIKKMVILF